MQKRGFVEVEMVVRRVKGAGKILNPVDEMNPTQAIDDVEESPDLFSRMRGNSRVIRITELGKEKIDPVWKAYEAFADHLFQNIPPVDLEAHYRVNKTIRDRLRPAWMQSRRVGGISR